MNRLAASLLLAIVARTAIAEEPAADLAAAVEALKAQVAANQKQLADQAAELGKLRAQLDAQPKSGAFHLGGLAVKLSGFIQADVIAYDQASHDELNPSTGEPLNETRFLIRRARFHADADYKWVSGALELDGNTVQGATARITNVEVSAKWPSRKPGAPPYLMASIGLMRIPFGFEVQQLDYVRLFLERTNVMRALFPGEFDLGARVQGGWRFLRYQLAAMNGTPTADKQFAARDPNQSKDILGRLGVDTMLSRRVKLEGGLSGLYGTGFHAGTPATKDTVVWHDTNLDGQVDPTELTGVLGQPAVPSQDFSRYAFGGDLRLTIAIPRIGDLFLYGELVWASNLDRGLVPADPVAAGRDLRERGWYLAFTQELTRWALVGVRYDHYDPDSDATDHIAASVVPRDSSFSTLAVAVAVAYQPYARFTIEYDHNTNALGRTASGSPATLGGEVLSLRAQLVY